MTSNALERRVTRLENETLAIYDEIKQFRRETASRFDAVDTRLESVDTRLDAVDTRLDAVDTRLESVDTRLHAVQTGVTEVLRRLPEPC